MRKFSFLFALCSLLFVACDKENDPINTSTPEKDKVESITVTPATLELEIGQTEQLAAEVLPADADVTLEWKSTNEAIVTVDADGKVTGIASGTAVVMAFAGDKTGSVIINVVGIPVESITLDYHELELMEGQQFTLSASVLPENADNKSIVWTSSDKSLASVNGGGTITAHRSGEVTITAKAGKKEDSCVVTITAAPLTVGDYYYSDGTWSQSLDSTKTPIGVVFYVGDITEHDPALKAEHPNCTHGLVVALDEKIEIGWQVNCDEFNDTVGRWVEMNTEYETITSGYELTDNLNRPMGYNNTKAIEAFNADEKNAAWKVDVMTYIVDYRTQVAAPESSSGWYLGSSKEMSMLVSGDHDGNIWDIRDQGISVQNKKDINKKIEKIEGATQIGVQIPVMMFYWTSTEFDWEFAGLMMPANGQMPQGFKRDNQAFYTARAILAF